MDDGDEEMFMSSSVGTMEVASDHLGKASSLCFLKNLSLEVKILFHFDLFFRSVKQINAQYEPIYV